VHGLRSNTAATAAWRSLLGPLVVSLAAEKPRGMNIALLSAAAVLLAEAVSLRRTE